MHFGSAINCREPFDIVVSDSYSATRVCVPLQISNAREVLLVVPVSLDFPVYPYIMKNPESSARGTCVAPSPKTPTTDSQLDSDSQPGGKL